MFIDEIIEITVFEFKRSKRIFFFGILIPSFILFFVLLIGLSINAQFSLSTNLLLNEKQQQNILQSVTWSIQFLLMFHVIIIVPWLFESKELEIYLFSCSNNTLSIVLGRILTVSIQEYIICLLLTSLSLFYLIIVIQLQISVILIFLLFICLSFAIILINTLIFAITLLFRSSLFSTFTSSAIVSLYLFGLPIFMVVNVTYGFLQNETIIINPSYQLQAINNLLLELNTKGIFTMDITLFFLIITEFIISTIILVHRGSRLRL